MKSITDMNKYLAILRGINVGGRRKLLMADLKLLCQDLGWVDVQTYIQSGNVLFDTNKKINVVKEADKLQEAIKAKYDYDVPVIIVSFKDLKKVADNNPFAESKDFDISQLHLTFLEEKPSKEGLAVLKNLQHLPDEFKIVDKYVYLKILTSYHKTKLNNNLFEKKLAIKATTRNWKTVSKLLELAIEK